MKPVSVLDRDFDQKIAALPHDEARASVMEHTIRAYINAKIADNPVFYGKLSEQLERIIQDLRNKVIDAAKAAELLAAQKAQLDSEADIAAQLGLSSESFAIYEIIGQGGTSMISESARAEYHVRIGRSAKGGHRKGGNRAGSASATWSIGRRTSRSSVSCAATSSAC